MQILLTAAKMTARINDTLSNIFIKCPTVCQHPKSLTAILSNLFSLVEIVAQFVFPLLCVFLLAFVYFLALSLL
jgi:hypothetical protein